MKNRRKVNYFKMLSLGFLLLMAAGCSDTIDNFFSHNNSEIQISESGDYVKLDENTPNETALTLDWNAAHDYGNEYITTYKYEMQVDRSSANIISKYEDDGRFHREYTHAELQDLLVNHFGLATSTIGNVIFTVTASFLGPTLRVPDIATKTIKIKTYGPKQFRADHLYMAGSAVPGNKVELQRTETDSLIYTYTGRLLAGQINFPLINFDENNAIGPASADSPVTLSDMPAIVTDESVANYWTLTEEDTYRITVNLKNHTVKILATGAVVEVNQMYLAGSAVGSDQIQINQTLENNNLYAWKGTLNKGELYLPLTFNDEQEMSIVPYSASNHDINDGQSQTFTQVPTANTSTRYWSIPEEGEYRFVVNTEDKSMHIYSATTDMKSAEVQWNNTTLHINPYTTKVDTLWMYGTFNGFDHDTGLFVGYQKKYTLKQSLANPNIFVYSGEALPRSSQKDERGNTIQASIKFTVDYHNNNVYAYGSTADAKRNDHNGYITVSDNTPQRLVAGQGDNRYAYFILPEGCNYIVVDIKNLTVIFDKK